MCYIMYIELRETMKRSVDNSNDMSAKKQKIEVENSIVKSNSNPFIGYRIPRKPKPEISIENLKTETANKLVKINVEKDWGSFEINSRVCQTFILSGKLQDDFLDKILKNKHIYKSMRNSKTNQPKKLLEGNTYNNDLVREYKGKEIVLKNHSSIICNWCNAYKKGQPLSYDSRRISGFFYTCLDMLKNIITIRNHSNMCFYEELKAHMQKKCKSEKIHLSSNDAYHYYEYYMHYIRVEQLKKFKCDFSEKISSWENNIHVNCCDKTLNEIIDTYDFINKFTAEKL
jgi:hypothetical protein